jgi:hypothetical protein
VVHAYTRAVADVKDARHVVGNHAARDAKVVVKQDVVKAVLVTAKKRVLVTALAH